MRKLLIVGGGYAGLYAARKLEKKLRKDEASVTLVDPRPYMAYQSFLPEVAFGELLSLATALLKHYPELGPDELGLHLAEVRPDPARGHRRARTMGAPAPGGSAGPRPSRHEPGVGRERPHRAVGRHGLRQPPARLGRRRSQQPHRRPAHRPAGRPGPAISRSAPTCASAPQTPQSDAWAAGDNAAVPNLASDIPGGSFTVSNAQHAVRQGK